MIKIIEQVTVSQLGLILNYAIRLDTMFISRVNQSVKHRFLAFLLPTNFFENKRKIDLLR